MDRRFAIFGSCVTRDAFELSRQRGGGHAVAVYVARTTINSCLARPVALAAMDARTERKFEERCVVSDLAKTHFAELRGKPFDYLIVDLIDERHPVLMVDGSMICHSVPLGRMAQALGVDLAAFAGLAPHDPRNVQATLDNIPRFVAALAQVADPARIVLHEAVWAPRYLAADGSVRPFADQAYVERCNRTLESYYAAIRAACPALTPIRIGGGDLIADEGHRWTLEPYHYAERYYDAFLRRLDTVAASPQRLAA